LICDEQEWLARPASWGIDVLPEDIKGRKQNLFNAHYFGWLAGFIRCEECRPHVVFLLGEGGVQIPPALAATGDDWRDRRAYFRSRYVARHPLGNCDAEPIIRCVCNYECGVVTQSELFNRIVDHLYSHTDRLGREEQTARYSRMRKSKERELALELVGPNPFRPTSFFTAWRTSTAVALARQMYESRDFGAMPILADALQEAGCEDAAILDHCRGEGPHVRGCWVVDLVLGKQ
jgi:hypothetical protein